MSSNPLYPKAPSFDNYHLPPFPNLTASGSEKRIEEVLNFDSRETDIILNAYPKSGSNWLDDILYMLTTGNTQYRSSKGLNSILEAADFGILNKTNESPRLLDTHLPVRHLPRKHIKNGYKIIHLMRNPKDIAVSFYNHLKRDRVMASETFPGTWDTFIENFMNKQLDLYGNWFDHAKEWEEAKASGKCRNVHTMTFEDLKKDPIGEVKRLSVYLGQKHSDGFFEDVATKCSFDNVVEATKSSVKDITVIKSLSIDGSDFIRRKGEVGNWKKWFTVHQNERFDELIEKEMKNSKIKMIYQL